MSSHEVALEVVRRALERLGVSDGRPCRRRSRVELADYLRGHGVTVHAPTARAFEMRRRVKDERALEGIRTAQRATEAAFAARSEMLGASSPGADGPDARGRAAHVPSG